MNPLTQRNTTHASKPESAVPEAAEPEPAWLHLVADKVQTLQYGIVQIVVHDSRVVQVERTERHRFDVQRNG